MTMEEQYCSYGQAGVRPLRTNPGQHALPQGPRRESRSLGFALLVAILLAFTWQSFVTQTHVHFDLSAPPAQSAHLPKGGRLAANASDNCPICLMIAGSGHHLLPTSVAVQVRDAMAFWLITILPPVRPFYLRFHTWHSRAPPA